MNRAILIGNLGNDPQLKEFDSGNCKASFPLATSSRYKKDDEWVTETEWHNIVVWGPRAKTAEKYLQKGSKVCVEGEIRTRSYEKDDEIRYVTEINAKNIEFLDSKESGGKQESKPKEKKPAAPFNSEEEDDLPF